jgi:hypothetical protein
MSEPRRFLRDSSATDFERDLLASYAAEQPSSAARARAVAIAGVAAVGTVAASAGASAAAGGVAAPKVVAVGVGALLKVGIVATMVVAVGVVGVVVERRVHGAAPSADATASPGASVSTSTNASPGESTSARPETRAVSPEDLPSAPESAASTHAVARAATSGPRTEGTLAEEIAAFDRARGALEGGQADRALSLIDDYETRFPNGTFGQEAEVLRVKALVHAGDRAGASRAGQRFLAAHPTSPHAARVRAILESSTP